MNRIELSSTDAGSADYTFNVNPVFYDPIDNVGATKLNVIHGGDIYQRPAFDSRLRKFRWEKYDVNHSSFQDIVDYFRSIEGKIRYFNFKDIEDMNDNWPSEAVSVSTASWKKARIIDLECSYLPGGRMRYNSVIVSIQPEK